ncbi:MAG: hypothetical protein JSS69_06010 [Acidobacteria bacterium]|nr:hypothetical protein [Acidobacteriota bacterium]MBS1865456.1 hypothetical protein [Acidobacteriota bacterium]
MFCPFCKAEYRAGIARCSDCSIPLVDAIPKDESDPNFMALLWNGESLPFLEVICGELDRAAIAVATPRVEVLLRDPADRYHLKQVKTFSFVLGVFSRDLAAARKILESVAGKNLPPISLPPVGAYPKPFDESTSLAHSANSAAPLEAIVPILSSSDLRQLEFLEASLDGIDIPFRRIAMENGGYKIQVLPKDENAARQVVGEIDRGISAQAAAGNVEAALLHDEPPTSYFLAWLLPAAYWFVFDRFFRISNASNSNLPVFVILFTVTVMEAISVIGSFWMVYQALRYEVKPLRYCVMALIPLTCVWYYVERYSVRKGEQRLPISARIRSGPPTAS